MVYPFVINIILSLIQIYIYKYFKKRFPNMNAKDNTIGVENIGNEESKLE